MDLKDKKTSKHVVQPEEICIRLEEQMPSAPASEQPSTSTSQQETQLQQQKRPHPQARNPRLKSQTSESLVSVGDGSVKSSERRYCINILFITYEHRTPRIESYACSVADM